MFVFGTTTDSPALCQHTLSLHKLSSQKGLGGVLGSVRFVKYLVGALSHQLLTPDSERSTYEVAELTWDDISQHGVGYLAALIMTRRDWPRHLAYLELQPQVSQTWDRQDPASSWRPRVVTAKPARKVKSECEREIKILALIMSLNALIPGEHLSICLEAIMDFLGCLQGGNGTSLLWLDVWLHLFSVCFHWHTHAPFYWNSRCHFFHPLFGKCSSLGQCRALCLFFRLLVVEI